jgi:hypothetical protein
MEAPIPPPRLDDDEDVHWALSTATALWGRGERVEALKWLRRAAEQASDVNADKRALELFKAAAEVANQNKAAAAAAVPAETPPPPPARPPPPPARPPPVPQAGPPRPGSVFPPPPAPRPPSVPAPPPAHAAPGPTIPGAPRPPLPVRSAPPPPPGSAPVPQARSAPPPAPMRTPLQVTPPARPVAISSAKAPMPQAIPPKRRRSFTGEPRPVEKPRVDAARPRPGAPVSQPAATSPQKHHRRKTHTDDDAHSRQTTPAADKLSSIWDDLDEDTRVINGRPGGDEIDQALARLRGAPAPVTATPPAAPALTPAPAPVAPGPRGQSRAAGSLLIPPAPVDADDNPFGAPEPTMVMHRSSASIHEELTSDGSRFEATAAGAPASEGGPATERPPSLIQGGTAAPRRLDTLPSVRVAVLGTSVPGEVRLISLDAGDEPPPGAALAVLVPLSSADGDALARLFSATE